MIPAGKTIKQKNNEEEGTWRIRTGRYYEFWLNECVRELMAKAFNLMFAADRAAHVGGYDPTHGVKFNETPSLLKKAAHRPFVPGLLINLPLIAQILALSRDLDDSASIAGADRRAA